MGQIGPLFGRRQFVGFEIILVPHQAVTADSKAEIFAVEIVDRKIADLGRYLGHDFLRRRVLFEEPIAVEGLKRIRRTDPKNVRFRFRLGLAQVGDTGVGLLAIDDHRGTGMFRFESFFVGLEQFLGK